MKRMKVYAYVTSETASIGGRLYRAYLPGETTGRDSTPVSRDGDLNAWTAGKRETIRLAAGEQYRKTVGSDGLATMKQARAVCDAKGWDWESVILPAHSPQEAAR